MFMGHQHGGRQPHGGAVYIEWNFCLKWTLLVSTAQHTDALGEPHRNIRRKGRHEGARAEARRAVEQHEQLLAHAPAHVDDRPLWPHAQPGRQ